MSQLKGHKWFAYFYDRMSGRMEKNFLADVRRGIMGGARGRVLEIGCGTGLSFAYYGPAVSELVATEPDPYMLERARQRTDDFAGTLQIVQAPAEELPFPDESFDTVVSTLVLCTVRDPRKALTEIKRVLKPQGEFRFYEHVRSDGAALALAQDAINPVWSWFGGGCHPNRDTVRLIREAGFEISDLHRATPVPPVPPMLFIRPQVGGIARRPRVA
ncbi:MAG TPA: class I SAM-dependent methyltransferase [Dehalococcoidia bacterium]|nr:class I SAM-dependent methyltransferase [Dehalococcoidia bacterium]